MGARARTETDEIVVRRIVAMLLALANLAERASQHSRAVCCLVIWILRPAEAVVRDLVGEMADVTGGPLDDATTKTDDCFEVAMRLAAQLRLLAAMLDYLSQHEGWFEPRSGTNITDILCALQSVSARIYLLATGANAGFSPHAQPPTDTS